MKSIVFDRRPHVYLPEISAYIDYINKHLNGWRGYDSATIKDYNPLDYDVVWRFMGTDTKGVGRTIIHEYNSLSTGAFARIKNHVKKAINAKPAARVFLNDTVRSKFNFTDSVPYAMRDMGINSQFYQKATQKKTHDFVYAGSLNDRGGIVLKTLQHFKTHCAGATLLVIGGVPDHIHASFGNAPNITFTGRVPYEDVPALAKAARYGLNLMPDIYPLNIQTATKVIEYCALGLPVISTDYQWIRHFESTRKGRFLYLDKSLSNLNLNTIQRFDFHTPNVDDLEWNMLIKKSGLFEMLERI